MFDQRVKVKIALIFSLVLIASCESSDNTTPVVTQSPKDVSGGSASSSIAVPIDRLAPSEIPNDIQPDLEPDLSFRDANTNTLTSEQLKVLVPTTIDDMSAAFEAVLEANPALSIHSNEFALLIIDFLNGSLQPQQRRGPYIPNDPADDPFLRTQNAAELELLLANTARIVPTRDATYRAYGSAEARFGIGKTWKTRGDAFRHAYWNWLLSKALDVAWAEIYTTAHESTSPNDDDTRMDLNNNAVGRAVFNRFPDASATQARADIQSIDLEYVNEDSANVEFDPNRLVYLLPKQTLVLFDDGPSFDDVFGFSVDGNASENTALGGSKTYDFIRVGSGTHTIEITCIEDNTSEGCGFKYAITGAFINSTGRKEAGQIIIEKGETYTDVFTFPKIIDAQTDF